MIISKNKDEIIYDIIPVTNPLICKAIIELAIVQGCDPEEGIIVVYNNIYRVHPYDNEVYLLNKKV